MKVYGSLETFEFDRKDLFPVKKSNISYFDIQDVEIVPKMLEDKNTLLLKLNPISSEVGSWVYGLIGEDYQKEFLEDMGLNTIEELVGKVVLGVFDKREELNGIFTPVEMYKDRR